MLMMRDYLLVRTLDPSDDFWNVFAQLLSCKLPWSTCHAQKYLIENPSLAYSHQLYKKKRLSHHDINVYSLAYYHGRDGKLVGVLINFTLSYSFDKLPPLSERAGTITFLAHGE